MNPLNLAFLAPIVMAWGTIKQTFGQISSLLFVHGTLDRHLADQMHHMLWTEWTPLPMGPRRHAPRWYALKANNGCDGPVVLKSYDGPVFFRKGFKIVRWHPNEGEGKLRCIRGNVNYEKLVEEATRRLYAKHQGEIQSTSNKGPGFYISRFQGSNPVHLGKERLKESQPVSQPAGSSGSALPSSPSSIDALGLSVAPHYKLYPMVGRTVEEFGYNKTLPPTQKHYIDPSMNVLVEEMETWLRGVSWMRKRGIAHRRGVLLKGPPGTGKSSLIRTLAEHFEIPLVIADLATCSDYDLEDLRVITRTPGIILFEDIDRIFDKDRNIVEREADKVTFDAFINLLSGVDALEGFIVLTTNHPENLAPVLIRPGRVDRELEVPLLSATGRKQIAERIMEGCDRELIDRILGEAQDQPAANFENTCIQAAMKWYWETNLENRHT